MKQLILAIILSILPISELRGGLPVAIDYALKNNLSILPIFLLILSFNILVIFFIFFFLDFLHTKFMGFSAYRSAFGYLLKRTQKRADKIEKKMGGWGYFALTLFVAVPLPVTGAWTGCLVAWILGLERKKSILAIGFGVLIAGLIILAASYGVLNLFY